MTVIGWTLDDEDRAQLLKRFPPEWPDVFADHIMLRADADQDELLPSATEAEIVGGINDGEGLQALVVVIGGSPDRPDGGISTSHDHLIARAAALPSRATI